MSWCMRGRRDSDGGGAYPTANPSPEGRAARLSWPLHWGPRVDRSQAETLVKEMAEAYVAEKDHDETDDGIRVTSGIVLEELTNLAGVPAPAYGTCAGHCGACGHFARGEGTQPEGCDTCRHMPLGRWVWHKASV